MATKKTTYPKTTKDGDYTITETAARNRADWTATVEYLDLSVYLCRRTDKNGKLVGGVQYRFRHAWEKGEASRRTIPKDADAGVRDFDNRSPEHALLWARYFIVEKAEEHVAYTKTGEIRETTEEKFEKNPLAPASFRDAHFWHRRDNFSDAVPEAQRITAKQDRANERLLEIMDSPDMEGYSSYASIEDSVRDKTFATKWIQTRTTKKVRLPSGKVLRPVKQNTARRELADLSTLLNVAAKERRTDGKTKYLPNGNPLDWNWIPEKEENHKPAAEKDQADILLGKVAHPKTGKKVCYVDLVDPSGRLAFMVAVVSRYGRRDGSARTLTIGDRYEGETSIRNAIRRSGHPLVGQDFAQVWTEHGCAAAWHFSKDRDKEGIDTVLPENPDVAEAFRVLQERNPEHFALPGNVCLVWSQTDPYAPHNETDLRDQLHAAERLAHADGWTDVEAFQYAVELEAHRKDVETKRAALEKAGEKTEEEIEDAVWKLRKAFREAWPDEYGWHCYRSRRATESAKQRHRSGVINTVGGWVVADKSDVRERIYTRAEAEEILQCAHCLPASDPEREEAQRKLAEAEERARKAEERAAALEARLERMEQTLAAMAAKL